MSQSAILPGVWPAPYLQKPPFKAMSMALLAELGLVVCAALILAQQSQQPATPPAQTLSLVAEEAPPPPKVEAPQPVVPKPQPREPAKPVPRQPQAKSQPRVQPAAPATPQEARQLDASPAEQKTATTTPAEPAPAIPTPAPAASSKGPSPSDLFIAKLRAAVQAAVVYPSSLRELGIAGQAQVAFIYLDGTVRDAKVVRSSGTGAMDRAALAAVSAATMPAAPPELQGHEHNYVVTVRFQLN